MEMVVRMSGAVEVVLEKLVEKGYFKTKSEALRAGILGLGREYRLFEDKDVEAELVVRKIKQVEREITDGKRKLVPLDEVIKQAGFSRKDLE